MNISTEFVLIYRPHTVQNTVPRPAVFLWVDIVDCDDGVLDSGLVIVGVGLSPHAEGVGLEAGHAEHGVIPKN